MLAKDASKPGTVKGGVDLEKVRTAIAPVLQAHGVALLELEWITERAGWTLRITIERLDAKPVPPGTVDPVDGVTLEDCAEVSRDCSSVLDVEDLIPTQYNLEVSSPGLDRKLYGPADFVRFRGYTAKVKLARPAPDGQRVLRGPIEEASDGMVAIVADGKHIAVPVADIVEARLVFELQTGTKKGGPKGSQKPGKQLRERGGQR
ncbi:MAG: ribosome maturation factor RimP [Polyangiaceae bacterium]|nr:ribosome maturation factor RimP [Polyangiaceae bacterium]